MEVAFAPVTSDLLGDHCSSPGLFLNPLLASLDTLIGPSLAPWLSGYSDFPLTTQATPSHLPHWFLFLHPFISHVTQALGKLSYAGACNCYLDAEDMRTLPLNFQTASHLLNQSPQMPLRHPRLVISETEAVIFPQQTCQRRGGASGFEIYRIRNLKAWVLFLTPPFGGKPTQVPKLVTRSSALPSPIT